MTGVVFDIGDDDTDAEIMDLAKLYIETDLEMVAENGYGIHLSPSIPTWFNIPFL